MSRAKYFTKGHIGIVKGRSDFPDRRRQNPKTGCQPLFLIVGLIPAS